MTAPTWSLQRYHWRNWPVLIKLIGVLLVPTLVALVVGVLRIVDQAGSAPSFERIVDVAGVQQQLSATVTELQAERDLAAAYVANERRGDAGTLQAQFAEVDAALGELSAATEGNEAVAGTGLADAVAQLGGLGPLRQSVVAGRGPADVAVAEYGAAIDPLIDADAALARRLDDGSVSGQAAALHALLVAREQVARQHALLLPALIVDQLEIPTVEAIRAAGVRLDSELATFNSALAPAERARFAESVGGAAEQSRQRIIQLVVDRGLAEEPPATPPADWDARTAAVVEPMLNVEQQLREQVVGTATALRDDARSDAGWNAVLLLFALAFGVLVSFVIARSMLQPLGILRRTALDVADERLPAAVASVRGGSAPAAVEPVPVHTNEEIGQVARAFDAVHVQAVRLAGEQAQLRSNVNDMFVNLSRRSQGLVQRQLTLIDSLESSEEDPEALDNLFQLDHLATRMRRNSENLLVLAGTESAKRSGRPVRLVDVLRASVSEVEQYQRLVLQPPPGVLVLGRAASDLVHLLAEVLDNATLFSPPDSQVMISGQVRDDGSVVIEVDDRGVGMGDTEFAEANERLATSPTVDASVSRRMGLFVVGRLAGRHGIDVTLRRGDDGVGVTAAVALPPNLVRATETGEDGTPDGPPQSAGTQPAGPEAVGLPRREAGATAGLNGNGTTAANGNGHRPATVNGGRNGGGGLTPGAIGDWTPETPPGSGPAPDLPRRNPDRPGPGPGAVPAPPPLPQRPTPQRSLAGSANAGPGAPGAGAPEGPGERSTAWDLFRSPSEGERSTALGQDRQRSTLQNATPIFDDVASAWFRESNPMPERWAKEEPAAQQPEPALQRRRPGHALAGSPEAATEAEPQARQAPVDWGRGDAGWEAAEALSRPGSGAEVTAAGLPRRQPRAQLVPGAADSAVPSGGGIPARDAEAVRGRLASYQRGVRQGREIRRDLERESGEQGQQHAADEETQ